MIDPGVVFALLGKDETLTGRTLIWPYVIEYILDRPLLGWGYKAFWSTANPAVWQIADDLRRQNQIDVQFANSHNGLLELLLNIGLVGTSLFIFIWLRYLVAAVKSMNGPAGRFGLSLLLLLLGILVAGTSEQVLLTGQQIWTILFFAMGPICEKRLWLVRASRTLGKQRPRFMSPASPETALKH